MLCFLWVILSKAPESRTSAPKSLLELLKIPSHITKSLQNGSLSFQYLTHFELMFLFVKIYLILIKLEQVFLQKNLTFL